MQFLFGIILFVLLAAAWSRIFKRLGWSSWWGLTVLIPPVIYIVSAVMYFQRWPIERRLEELEQELKRPEIREPQPTEWPRIGPAGHHPLHIPTYIGGRCDT